MWCITTRSLVASIQLAHWVSDDQGFLIMDIIYVNWQWGHVWHDGQTPNISIVMRSSHKVQHYMRLRNVVTYSLDCEIIFNHYHLRLPWLHQWLPLTGESERCSSGIPMRVGWGVCIKIRICVSEWWIDTLGPLGDDYIHQACKHVTRSWGYVMSRNK